jgi:F420-non-reducing hydrogenase large subunit
MSKAIDDLERKMIAEKAGSLVGFAQFSLQLFRDLVLGNSDYLKLVLSKDLYYTPTHYMGTVDPQGRLNFYDGEVRVVDPIGKEAARFKPAEYLDYVAEHVEPWSYLKFAYMKKGGWHGLGLDQSEFLVRVGPLARMNVSSGMGTPLAQAEYEKFFETFGCKPVHHTMAYHWARLIELLYAAERLAELSADPVIASPDVRNLPTGTPGEGVGIIEAARGTLIHHIKADSQGRVERANLVVATGFNYGPICSSIAKIAKATIKDGKADEGTLNKIEMAFRAYDPCLSCATHALSGGMALILSVRDSNGRIVDSLRRD